MSMGKNVRSLIVPRGDSECNRTRREFIKKVALTTAASAIAPRWAPAFQAGTERDAPREGRKLKYVGWQVGVTYQAKAPGGLDRDYLMRLLDEMAQNKMNLLSLMMNSTASNDLVHDGYCWPVRNPKLKSYWDSASTNGQASTEFVRDIIAAAGDRGIQIHFLMNGFWWTPEKIWKGYPSAECQQTSREAALQGKKAKDYWFCPDSPEAWEVGLDEVTDLLTYYNHRNVMGYGFEMLYCTCWCPWTQKKYRQETGASIFDAEANQLKSWRAKSTRAYLAQYAHHIRRLMPKATVWLHSDCNVPGHEPAGLKACGIDYVLPLILHMPTTKADLLARLAYLSPNPFVLHFCTRDRRPANYNLWIKTPEIIRRAIDWVLECPGEHLAGFLFFNENATSPQNKKAVYEQIKRFVW